ncbi:major facilitator superfamily transporter [Secundilactobacillus pentosiphilus]|uniref:Major facilitator superfamily transporter n=1 Tax=Secundilactobacillus pentosiphilus TaxID=1714682 RepID=A0A1Z5IME8_9LACO|nr:MFS transporter [Secundilactobacillus pentosiphilus]GAX02925.1 major facilitator superfamily transporter [Secundilactobacillus pentosiphilus]
MNENEPRRWWILLSIGIFAFMSNLDSSIVNVAMPIMAKQLAIPMNKIEWVVSIYLIVVSALLLFFGKLGDMYGKIKVFRIGMAVFIMGSFISGLQWTFEFLLLGRVIQGIGSAMTLSNTYGITTATFSLKERGKAMGLIGTFVSFGAVAGPGIGGLVLSHFSWGYIFWINVPLGIFAMLLGQIVLPKTMAASADKRIDWPGSVSFALLIVSLFLAIFWGQEVGYFTAVPLAGYAIAVISISWFIHTERRSSTPLMPLNIFKIKPFSYGIGAAILIFLSNFFTVVLMPFYLEDARRLSAGQAGLLMIIFPVVTMIAGPIGGVLADRFNPAKIVTLGLSIVALSQLGYWLLNLHSSLWVYAMITVIMAAGTGLFQSPNSDIVMSVVSKDQLGSAGSINALARNIGMVSGTALATTVLFSVMSLIARTKVTTYLPDQPQLFIAGMHVAFTGSFLFIVLAILLSLKQGELDLK